VKLLKLCCCITLTIALSGCLSYLDNKFDLCDRAHNPQRCETDRILVDLAIGMKVAGDLVDRLDIIDSQPTTSTHEAFICTEPEIKVCTALAQCYCAESATEF